MLKKIYICLILTFLSLKKKTGVYHYKYIACSFYKRNYNISILKVLNLLVSNDDLLQGVNYIGQNFIKLESNYFSTNISEAFLGYFLNKMGALIKISNLSIMVIFIYPSKDTIYIKKNVNCKAIRNFFYRALQVPKICKHYNILTLNKQVSQIINKTVLTFVDKTSIYTISLPYYLFVYQLHGIADNTILDYVKYIFHSTVYNTTLILVENNITVYPLSLYISDNGISVPRYVNGNSILLSKRLYFVSASLY